MKIPVPSPPGAGIPARNRELSLPAARVQIQGFERRRCQNQPGPAAPAGNSARNAAGNSAGSAASPSGCAAFPAGMTPNPGPGGEEPLPGKSRRNSGWKPRVRREPLEFFAPRVLLGFGAPQTWIWDLEPPPAGHVEVLHLEIGECFLNPVFWRPRQDSEGSWGGSRFDPLHAGTEGFSGSHRLVPDPCAWRTTAKVYKCVLGVIEKETKRTRRVMKALTRTNEMQLSHLTPPKYEDVIRRENSAFERPDDD
ncbi:uncharacterized protein LOC134562979 isoform X3 [Prinia subflava]|uniref:uncharacterized protein LOC134562979 isoform X3 n=1 Tax=Prinia subflava TaxID=208062 RepID=UPI002FE195EF